MSIYRAYIIGPHVQPPSTMILSHEKSINQRENTFKNTKIVLGHLCKSPY